MKKAFLLFCVTVLIVGLSACQQTPDQAVVVGKGDGRLEDMISTSEADEQFYDVHRHWKESVEISDLSVLIDADINMPGVGKIPAAVITADEITQEQASKIMEVFLKGATLYEKNQEGPQTKQEIMEEILRVKAELADPDSEANQWQKQTGSDEKNVALNEYLSELESAYENAPETYERTEALTIFKTKIDPEMLAPVKIPEDATEEQRQQLEKENANLEKMAEELAKPKIEGVAELDNGEIANITIAKTSASFSAGYNPGVGAVMDDDVDLPIIECKLSEDQAVVLAISILEELGLDYLDIAAITKSYSIETSDSLAEAAKTECYVFYCTRKLNGVLSNYAFSSSSQDDQYVELGANESVIISVGDQGVLSFNWDQPSKLVSIENNNLKILAFSEIQEIFKKQILIKGAWNSSSGSDKAVISRHLVIENATLGLIRIVRQDKPGEYLLLPAWDFYGYEVNKYSGQQPGGYVLDENNERVVQDFGRSYLTINAIDGSIIDRGLGY